MPSRSIWKVPSGSFRNGLSRLTFIAPIPSPAKAPELSATVIGTWVETTPVQRKSVAVARLSYFFRQVQMAIKLRVKFKFGTGNAVSARGRKIAVRVGR